MLDLIFNSKVTAFCFISLASVYYMIDGEDSSYRLPFVHTPSWPDGKPEACKTGTTEVNLNCEVYLKFTILEVQCKKRKGYMYFNLAIATEVT